MNYFGRSGTNYSLGNRIGGGGEGDIFEITNLQGKVAKLYNPGHLTKEMENKLIYMTTDRPPDYVLNNLAWPEDVIYDNNKKNVGFVMRRLNIKRVLETVYDYNPGNVIYSLQENLAIAKNISKIIDGVHSSGYIFGDFNPKNIGVDEYMRVYFLDCDSFHITKPGATYRCKVCLDGYVAPELIRKLDLSGRDFETEQLSTFTKETDYFALAIHIFKLLNNGYTPYSGIPDTQTSVSPLPAQPKTSTAHPGLGSNAVRKHEYINWPGYKPSSAVAIPRPGTHTPDIEYKFNQTFIDGHSAPNKRVTPSEWLIALENYQNPPLITCKANPRHQYRSGLSSCPWNEADERLCNKMGIKLPQHGATAIPPKPVYPPSYPPPSPIGRQTGPGTKTGSGFPFGWAATAGGLVLAAGLVMLCLIAFALIMSTQAAANTYTDTSNNTGNSGVVPAAPTSVYDAPPSDTPIPYPTDLPQGSINIDPTNIVGGDRSNYYCNDQSKIRLGIGKVGIVNKYDLNLRKLNFYLKGAAGLTKQFSLAILHESQRLTVINGPLCYKSGTWWYVQADNISNDGWVREFSPDNNDYYVVPGN